MAVRSQATATWREEMPLPGLRPRAYFRISPFLLDRIMPTVRLPDGVVRDYSPPACVADMFADLAAGQDPKPKRKDRPIAVILNGKAVGLDAPLPDSGEVVLEPLHAGDPRALPVMRHSAAHVMARAVMRLFKDVELAFGPTVGDGFYYDMRAERPITDEDVPAIEAEMKKIIK